MQNLSPIDENKDLITKEYVDAGLSGKQNTLTFDTTPTENSTNPVTSGGVRSALNFVPETGNAGWHNSVYRGKNLGSSVTTAQWNAISAGTFDDLFIGDYWEIPVVISGTSRQIRWRIAAFDYWYNTGDNTPETEHHAVIVPDKILITSKMNSSNTTSGGYAGSDFFTGNNSNVGKETITSIVTSAFGASHVKTLRRMFSNSVSSSGSSNGAIVVDSTVDLMSSIMLAGHIAIGSSYYEIGYDRTILPLFLLRPEFAVAEALTSTARAGYTARDVASTGNFLYISGTGRFTTDLAGNADGIRPAFAIKG